MGASVGDHGREELEQRARRRHGVILRAEAVAAGMTKAQIDRRIRRGQWATGPAQGVLLLGESVDEPLSRLMAGLLVCPNSLAFGRSAIALWDLQPHPSRPMIVTARRRHVRGVDLVLRSGAEALPTTRRRGIATVSLEVGLASMAATNSAGKLHRLIDEALRRRLTTTDRVLDACDLLATSTRVGRSVLRQVISDRTDAGALPLSEWSRDFADRVVAAGLPRPEMEFRILTADGELVAQVDLAFPACRSAFELDSVAFHFDLASFESDRRRDIEIADAGWRVDRITWRQYVEEWDWILDVLRRRLGTV